MSRRRQELLDIAADLFAEHGFANVTVDDIGDAAGVSGPALYHHFPGKEALLGEMLIGISEYLLTGGREVVARGGDVLTALIEFHARFAVDDRSLITVHFRDLVHATAADRSKVRNLQARYVGLWADALQARSPDLDRRAAQAVVHAVLGLLNSTPFSTRLPRTGMLDLLAKMAEAALLAGSPDDRLTIEDALPGDAGELVTLQRAAFLADAQIYDDPFMPSLVQSADEIAALIADPAVIVLVARAGGRLVGSVRAALADGVAHIGRLMTAPDRTGEGIASRLMDAIETRLHDHVLELETGSRSDANIAFYEHRGYRIVERAVLDTGLEVVHLRRSS